MLGARLYFLLFLFHFLQIFCEIDEESYEDQGDGKLADQRGMLLTEVGLLRQVIFEDLLSSANDFAKVVLQDVASGKTWSAIHQLGIQLSEQLLKSKAIGVRDLGTLRALADIGTFELVGALDTVHARTAWNHSFQHSRAKWLESVAKDMRWLKDLLPRGDRALIAISHAVLSWMMFSSLGADSDGYVRIESMSSMTQAWWLAEQAASASVRKICEVGFNGGHSALAMLLSASSSSKMLSFDLMSKSYTPACHRLIRAVFPRRHILIEGSSNVTVPRFVLANLHSKCDLIFIDGGHAEEEALADLLHMSMLATERTLVVMDDVGCRSRFCNGPSKAWNSFILSGRILEHGCQEEIERRWCWGTYNF